MAKGRVSPSRANTSGAAQDEKFDHLNACQVKIDQALSLADAFYELSAQGGDEALQQLGAARISTNMGTLMDLLRSADEHLTAGWPAADAEVAHG